MSGLGTDPAFRLNASERLLLAVLKVPEAPQPPDGSPDSLRVFRAGRNYYLWSIIMWALGALVAGVAVASASIPLVVAVRRAPQWGEIAAVAALVLLWSAYLAGAIVMLVSRRLNYGLRWYIVTDRSLRIRSGIFAMSELTMTYSNVQEIRISSGPLQLLLGSADVEVQAAGGGGDGAGSVAGGASPASLVAGPAALPPPEFETLDRLLEIEGAEGAAGPAGQFIAQLLGQTSYTASSTTFSDGLSL